MIKMIHKLNPDALEREVNTFINTSGVDVTDIQYRTELHSARCVNGFSNVTNTEYVTEHYAMITYKKG